LGLGSGFERWYTVRAQSYAKPQPISTMSSRSSLRQAQTRGWGDMNGYGFESDTTVMDTEGTRWTVDAVETHPQFGECVFARTAYCAK